MASTLSIPTYRRFRKRGNRLMGKTWLLLLFISLTGINFACSLITPFIGSYGPMYQGALFIATFWEGLLLAAVWHRQTWARFVLAAFLFGFVLGHFIVVPDALLRYPLLEGQGIKLVVLLFVANIFAAVFLLTSVDIRWLARPTND